MKDILFIIWTERQACGIPIIDEQHRMIAGLINSLYFLFSRNLFREAIMPLAKAVVYHIQVHNFTEEYLLTKADYPDLEQHRLLHRKNEQTLATAIRKTLEAYHSNVTRSDELMVFMKSYWLNHICEEDRKYLAHLKKHLGIADT